MDWLKEVKEDLKKARVVEIKQRDCSYEMARMLDIEGADKIMAPEAMGFHIGAALSMVTGLPLLMIRKRPYLLEGEVTIRKKTGYEDSVMYINSVREGDKIVLVDSILATGGTLLSIIQALQSHGVSVQDAGVVVTRKGLGGFERVLADTGVKIKTLLYVEIVNGEVLVTEK